MEDPEYGLIDFGSEGENTYLVLIVCIVKE